MRWMWGTDNAFHSLRRLRVIWKVGKRRRPLRHKRDFLQGVRERVDVGEMPTLRLHPTLQKCVALPHEWKKLAEKKFCEEQGPESEWWVWSGMRHLVCDWTNHRCHLHANWRMQWCVTLKWWPRNEQDTGRIPTPIGKIALRFVPARCARCSFLIQEFETKMLASFERQNENFLMG